MKTRARVALSILALVAMAFTLTGCGSSLVSRDQFLNTALGKEPVKAEKPAEAGA